MPLPPLSPDRLYNRCDLDSLRFETTDDLQPLEGPIGQPRAAEALRFGIGMNRRGYNIFALGEQGTGKHTLIRNVLSSRAQNEEVPSDVCYVNNFEDGHKPRMLILPAGHGKRFEKEMRQLVANVRRALRAAFENEDYQNRRQSMHLEFQERQQKSFETLQNRAAEAGLTLMRTPAGLTFAPTRDQEVLSAEEYEKLPVEERQRIEEKIQTLQKQAGKFLQQLPLWQREIAEKQKALDRQVSQFAVAPVIGELGSKYANQAGVADYLTAVEKDINDNMQLFLESGDSEQTQIQKMVQQRMGASFSMQGAGGDAESPALRRYKVNILVDNGGQKGAPVVYEENPTYENLAGRVEHLAQMGALVTDFGMIRGGALHRANGGYLILDALKVLQMPFGWEGLKRALRSGEIKIESIGQMYGMIATISLEPEPVPLHVKVVLIGLPMIYYLLRRHDPEFGELFKVAADFSDSLQRSDENTEALARVIASAVRQEGLRPFERGAVARVIEQSARVAGDAAKLSAHMNRLTDLLREADYWAGENGRHRVRADDVHQALEAWTYRSDQLRERMQEQIARGVIFVDTQGAKVGQINGLAVIQLGDFMFGRPSRITARIALGKGEVVDIEREVAMGGPIHSKGVLILAGYLGARYAFDQPLSLSASLVFEQSYSGVEGDSASSAELYALLSAIAQVPIRQSLAVTGSVNQYGQVQPIGGANEKIEGFFDICRDRGLTGEQGVLIPEANVQHLMLRQDVIDAVRQERFHIHAVRTIDEGIEMLTGLPAGEVDSQGHFPEETINGKVYRRLTEMARQRLAFVKAVSSREEA
ncbi:MAG: ATP-dependent protease [Desulfatitalea sp. BRH_c12]|nr:MAG: ATP-dependent protease [Desulfatitalea sp. BRH_c12]